VRQRREHRLEHESKRFDSGFDREPTSADGDSLAPAADPDKILIPRLAAIENGNPGPLFLVQERRYKINHAGLDAEDPVHSAVFFVRFGTKHFITESENVDPCHNSDVPIDFPIPELAPTVGSALHGLLSSFPALLDEVRGKLVLQVHG
jgi:hypothetical protein